MKEQKPSQNQIIPLVSVIIPFYNREEFLSQAIESVISQSEDNWELLLIDDGSTDRSGEIAEKYRKKCPERISIFRHPGKENKGASAARHLGIERARGSYITFLDSDDVYFPDALERELRAFRENPSADAVCGTLECWYSWSDRVEKREKDFVIDLVLKTEKIYQPPDLLVHNLRAGGRKPGINCVMLKSDFARSAGVFEEDYRYAWEDQVFWAKVSLSGRIYVTDAVLAKYRQHPGSTCAVETENGLDISSRSIFLEWLEKYLRERGVEDGEVWRAWRGFRRKVFLETRLRRLKQIYRRLFPLHFRYKLRDRWTRTKGFLAGASHRHK